VGLLGLIGTQGHHRAWPVDRVRQFGDRNQGTRMPIDPSMLAKSIGTLTDLHPELDLAETLQQAVQAAKQLFDADATGVMLVDLDGQLRWASASDQRAQTLEDNQEVFAAGPAWRPSELVGRRSCTTPRWIGAGGRSPWSLSRSRSARV
jgi:hypothetical protein